MSVATATPAQLALLSNFVAELRANMASFAQTIAVMNALNVSWEATISAIVGTPAGTLITDSSGLAGISQLTDTQVSSLMTDVQSVLTTYNSTAAQELFSQVCGPLNTLP